MGARCSARLTIHSSRNRFAVRLNSGIRPHTSMTEHLIYHPPKSVAFGHAPRKIDVRTAWKMAQEFIDRHTTGRLRSDIYAEAIGPLGYGGEKMLFPSQKYAKDLFGESVESENHWCKWRLTESDVPAVFDLFLRSHQHHRKIVSSFNFDLTYDFKWSDIEDSTIGGSFLGISFNDYNGIFLQPTFVFPFAWDALHHREWLGRVLDDSPFRFREQYFKRAVPTKTNDRYRTLKLTKGWLGAA